MDRAKADLVLQRLAEGLSLRKAAVFVYALCCPESGDVRYIGKARNPKSRYAGHLRENRRGSPLYRWIASLKIVGKQPEMRVIASTWAWEDTERAIIAQYREAGCELLNVADGGNEPSCSVEQRAINGRQVAATVHHGDPLLKRVWELRQALGSALKRGHLSDEVRAKMRSAAHRNPALFGDWAGI